MSEGACKGGRGFVASIHCKKEQTTRGAGTIKRPNRDLFQLVVGVTGQQPIGAKVEIILSQLELRPSKKRQIA